MFYKIFNLFTIELTYVAAMYTQKIIRPVLGHMYDQ
jgi:hypothetical protein